MKKFPSRLRFYVNRPSRLIKRLLPNTFWGRSLLIVITPVVLIQIISGYVFFDRHWEQTTKSLAHGIAGDIAMGSELLQQAPTRQAEEALFHLLSRTTGVFVKRSSSPPRLYKSWPFQSRLERALKQKLKRPYTLRVTPQTAFIWVHHSQNTSFCFSFPTKRLFSHTTPLWLFWSLGASFFFAFLASFFMRRQIRPLQQLALVAEGLEEGKNIYNHRIRGATEIRQLGQMFFLMQRRLIEQVEERTAFLAGISHDLRTPLTRMRLQIALMPSSSDLQALAEDLDQMIRMVEEYLVFIRQEENSTPQLIQLKSFCQMLLKSFEPLMVRVSLQIPDHLTCRLIAIDLRRCLQNLLENSFRYAKHHIQLQVTQEDGYLEIHVDDDGPGIPSSSYQEIFKPFFRLDSGRNLETGGTGLGLTIVQKLTHKMGGKVILTPSPLRGLRVTLQFPLVD